MYRNTYVNVNLDNLAHNVKTIINKYSYKYYIGVVKGNCYGHGYGIIKTLKDSGINYFAVANLEEALIVRDIDKNVGIMCLEPIDKRYLDICSKNNISIVIDDLEYYNEIKDLDYKLKFQVAIDSGMNRIGFNNIDDLDTFMNSVNKHDNFYVEGIFTHFATNGMYDVNYNNQLNRFIELTKNIDLSKIDMVHLDKGGTLTIHNRIPFENGVRLGLIMYGFEQFPKLEDNFTNKLRKFKWDRFREKNNIIINDYENLGLKNAFELISEVFEIKHVTKGSYIGYGTGCKAMEDMDVAVVDIGYKDGIGRKRKNTYMEINGKRYPVIGEVCMGMSFLKVDKSVKKHDKVYVIGDKITVKEVSRWLHTNVYEVMCLVDSSIERRYYGEN